MWLFGPPNIDKLKANNDIPALIKALNHNNKQTRQNAATVLGEIRDADTRESLIEVLEDQEPNVRLAAKEALDKMNWSPEDTREQALYAFASGDTSDAVLIALMPKVHINYGRYDWFVGRGFTLPMEVIVFDNDEADYTVDLIWEEAIVGRYTGGQKALQESCTVVIANCDTGKTVARKLFSSPPPQRIYGNASAGVGGPSFSEINEYIVQWYNNIDEPPSDDAWRGTVLRICVGLLGALGIFIGIAGVQINNLACEAGFSGCSSSNLQAILWSVVGGIIVALSIFWGRTQNNTHKILNYRKEAKRPVDPEDEKRRAQQFGIEVAICSKCGTMNSLALMRCEKCNENLDKVKPTRNPYL